MAKKNIDIIYRGDVRQVQGINYVTNSFINGKNRFEENSLRLCRVFSPGMIIDVVSGQELPIGANLGSVRYKANRTIRILLRKILDSRFPLFAWLKFYLNMLRPAKRVVNEYLRAGENDYIIFQDVFSAYYYYKNEHVKQHKKAILILHVGRNINSQLVEDFPGLFKSKILKNKFDEIVNTGLTSVDKIIYISKKAFKANLTINKSEYIYNGVADFPFVYSEPMSLINIVTVGSINGHKGQELLIEAIALLDEVIRVKIHVYLVGSGVLEESLKQRCYDLGIQNFVTFMGIRNDVAELLRNMHLFILPSISEGLPMSIIEALRQGLYIMTTDTGGTTEMIGEGFGEVITRDPVMIKDAISNVVIDHKINTISMLKARKHYEDNFRLENMIDKYAENINSL